ncbi:class I SAM-dependent methyltransferase [Sphingobium sp. AP50]|uniref:class I SAM-dependent methyltransferase n=1 Tax=Sphingobium sp. AP50 TaxID=1884369 RepID=UPI00116016EE|nr:class I SAM-dependent methyltransferase [Sphingobium sp. AP50]
MPKKGLALDVGAGSGRDAAWLHAQGYDVVAVEPADGFRLEGRARHSPDIRWLDDQLPSLDQVHRLGLAFDLIVLSAVWQHVVPTDRARAFRKLVTLLRAGGVMVLTLRSGPAPEDRPMFSTSSGEIEGLARTYGMEILKVHASHDLQGREGVSWTTVCLRLPDDGTSALPLIRGIVLGDEKSSTYKLGLLRAVARIAEQTPAAATPSRELDDAVDLPLGLVALTWVRLYLPLIRLGMPQAPRNSGPDGLSFAKAGFRALLADGTEAYDLRVGSVFETERGAAIAAAITEAARTIAAMPAHFTRFPNSEQPVFAVQRGRYGRQQGLELGVDQLRSWGTLTVPGNMWRALSRFGPWIEPMLVTEWARLIRRYADHIGFAVPAGSAEAALEWREPVRSTATARFAAQKLVAGGPGLSCVWTARRLSEAKLDVDHCLPWSAWPCGDLWNLAPCDSRINRHEKRDRLPSAAMFAESRERIITWWHDAYLDDAALRHRFLREAAAALPVLQGEDLGDIFTAFDWRRLRLLQDQRVPEWHWSA